MDLKEMVEMGHFRQDLFFRLSVIPIHIPPLRERTEDLIAFLLKFMERFNSQYGREVRLHQQTIDLLLQYAWPGNVRELENLVERLVLTVDGPLVMREDLPETILQSVLPQTGERGKTLNEQVDEFEAKLLQKAYQECGSTTKMAKLLGISQPSVVRKMKKYRTFLSQVKT